MRRARKGFGGGCVYHSVYIQRPINKLAGRGIKSWAIKEHSEGQVLEEVEKPCELPKDPSQMTTPNSNPLPKVAYFRVQYSNAFERLCKAPWVLLVSCRGDGKALRLASDVGHEFGVSIVECYKTRDDAIKAGMDIKMSWGKKKSREKPASAICAAHLPRAGGG